MKKAELARYIDHTLLKPTAVRQDFCEAAKVAVAYGCASLCIPPSAIELVKGLLTENSQTLLCTVIGFPLGYSQNISKVEEAKQVLALGVQEIDMVMNIGRFLSGDYAYVQDEIASIVTLANKQQAIVKVIIETSYLNDAQKRQACQLVQAAQAHFVKTSTGFSGSGATVPDIVLLRQSVGAAIGVKASGGVKDYASVLAMIKAGANRVGSSSTVAIMAEAD